MLIALLIMARTGAHRRDDAARGNVYVQARSACSGRSGREPRFPRRLNCVCSTLARWSLVAALLSALLWFWLEVANMSGLPPCGLFPPQRGRWFCLKRNSVDVWQLRLGLIVSSRLHSSLTELAQDPSANGLIMAVFLMLSVVFSSRLPGSATLQLPACNRSACSVICSIFVQRVGGSADWYRWQFF